MTNIPEDLYTTPTLVATIKALEERADARRKSYVELADLFGAEATKQDWRGVRNWIRANPVFSEHTSKEISEKTSVFKLFRLPAPIGLGYSRLELEKAPVARLRRIVPYPAWALKHTGRVREILDPTYKITPEEITKEIRLHCGNSE